MPITASISINVPALPDNDVWFANAAAWSNYWTDISGDVTLDPIAVTVYTETAYSAPGGVYVLEVDGVEHSLATEEMFNSLKACYDTLNASYKALRLALYNAGLIDNT